MATLNNARMVRFENGGILMIGSDTVVQIVAGTLRFTKPRRVRRATMDRGEYRDEVVEGDEQLGEVEFEGKVTAVTHDANELVAKLESSVTAGNVTLINLSAIVADYDAATTGRRHNFTGAFIRDVADLEFRSAGPGAEPDTLRVRLNYHTYTSADYSGTAL